MANANLARLALDLRSSILYQSRVPWRSPQYSPGSWIQSRSLNNLRTCRWETSLWLISIDV